MGSNVLPQQLVSHSSPAPCRGRPKARDVAAVALVAGTLAGASLASVPSGFAAGTAQPTGRVTLWFANQATRGSTTFLSGQGWLPLQQVRLRFSQLLYSSPPFPKGLPAITGLVVRANPIGRFRVALPGRGPCNMLASVSAGTLSGRLLPVARPHVFCHESPSPNPPVHRFSVLTGRYVRSTFFGHRWSRRYTLGLWCSSGERSRLSRKQAVAIARRDIHARRSMPAAAHLGGTQYGLAGICATVWQVVLDRARVPHYGAGHAVVIILAQTSMGVRPGTVVASWYGP
jgi:hypothetical protein